MDLLVSKHCNLKTVNNEGANIFHRACAGGHINMVKHIHSLGVADIDSRDSLGSTPVAYAAHHGYIPVVDFLKSKHCNLKTVDNQGSNILHEACKDGHVHMIKHLLSMTVADIESRGYKEMTPVMYASQTGQGKVVDFLRSQHCNLKALNNQGANILHIACLNGRVHLIKHILALGVFHIESRDSSGKTPLKYAVYNGHRSVVDFLISKRCNLKTVDKQGSNILHEACKGGHVTMVKHILSLGVSRINRKDSIKRTPVAYAVTEGHTSVVDFLISKHCNLKAVDKQGCDILQQACEGGHVIMVKHILSLGIADKERKGFQGMTALLYAVLKGQRAVVDFLISQHCNLKAIDSMGDNILHAACFSGHVDMVKYILSLGVADIESKGVVGRTPLLCAVMLNMIQVVDFLVSKHCNLKAVDNLGMTALKLACTSGHGDMVKHILSLDDSIKPKGCH